MKETFRILVINPGSTSTKIGVYDNETCVAEAVARHTKEELLPYIGKDGDVYGQKDMRLALIYELLEENKISLESLDAVVGRAGRLPPMPSGTYEANEELLKDVPSPLVHPALLGAVMAKEIGEQNGIPGFFVDPTVVDEITPVARVTGVPQIKRSVIFHALNQKAVARRYAKGIGKSYEQCRFVIAHLGGGISVAAHDHGVAVDVTNASNGEGPMSPERAGKVPAIPLIEMCFSGKYTQKEMNSLFTKRGGLNAYLGHSDFRKLEQMYVDGDEMGTLLFEAMAYAVAKEIGAMYVVLDCDVDAVSLTGGLAYSEQFTELIRKKIKGLGKIVVFPGEDELLALAEGALRVLRGEEKAIPYVSKGAISE